MLRLFSIIVIMSFFYIFTVIADSKSLDDFILADENHDFASKTSVHPLFEFLQTNYDPATRFKKQYAGGIGNWTEKEYFPIPECSLDGLTTKKFYRYFPICMFKDQKICRKYYQ